MKKDGAKRLTGNCGVVGYHVRLTRERSPVRTRVVAFLNLYFHSHQIKWRSAICAFAYHINNKIVNHHVLDGLSTLNR